MKKIILASAIFSLSLFSCDSDDAVYSGGNFVQFTPSATAEVSATESDATVNIPVALSNPSNSDLTVNFTYTDETAVNGTNYTGIASIVIPAGEVSAILSIPIIDDLDRNDSRTFKVSIASTSDANYRAGLGQQTAGTKTILIINDECDTTANYFVGNLIARESGYSPWNGNVGTLTATCNELVLNTDVIGTGVNLNHTLTFSMDPASDGSYGTVSSPVAINPNSVGTLTNGVTVYRGAVLTGTYNSNTDNLTLNYSWKLYSIDGVPYNVSGYSGSGVIVYSRN